jgi:hypothetical protein
MSHIPTHVLHQRLKELAADPFLSSLIEYVMVEQELKKRLDTTEPLFPGSVAS